MSKFRIAKCEHTKKEIIQEFINNDWLCLHKETPELDAISVESFKIGAGKYDEPENN